MTRAAMLLALALELAGCTAAGTPPAATSGSAPSAVAIPSQAPVTSAPPLTDAAHTWCLAHLGGLGPDEHRVEDMAIVNRLIAGASTPADVASRWARLTPDQLRGDPAYVLACLAAYAASSAAPS